MTRAAVCLFAAIPVLAGLACATNAVPRAEQPRPDDLPLVFETGFEDGLEGWAVTDPDVWTVVEVGGDPALALLGASDYDPPVRSPRSIARLEGVEVRDFVLTADCMQTGREYGHRDLCVFFGWQDPSHFYYVHLAPVADPHANSIFLVDGAPRVSIAEKRTDGTRWKDDTWHTVRVVRDVDTGYIGVYFDDMDEPVMVAHDATFGAGEIGFGSFDDEGRFDRVRLHGEVVE
jgi:hypothetical protein